MRREHIAISDSYIDYLKSLGCVFYAPLDQEHGFTDLITNVVGEKTSNGTITWNSTHNAYQFHANDRYCAMIFENVDAFVNESIPFPVTFLYRTMFTSANYWDNIVGLGGDPATGSYYRPNTSQRISCYIAISASYITNARNANTWYDLAWGCGADGAIKCYNGGQFVANGPNMTGFVAQSNEDYYKKNLLILAANSYWYLKDYMVFNRELDLATIRKIQGYE